MRRLIQILTVLLVLFIFNGPPFWQAHADDLEYSKRIVVFHEQVTQQEIMQYAQEREHLGVSIIMELPFINGLVLNVPTDISSLLQEQAPACDFFATGRSPFASER